jgi:hypothetical protein
MVILLRVRVGRIRQEQALDVFTAGDVVTALNRDR